MTMKLYYWPRTRAFRALWMLEEIEAPYELVHVNLYADEQKREEYRKINPMMKVPALEDGKVVMAESAAILFYLADKYPEKHLAPAQDDPQRGRFLQWLFFAAASLEPAMAEKFSGAKTNPFSYGWGDLTRVTEALEYELNRGPWILGEQFTAADIMLGNGAKIAIQAGLWENVPPVKTYLERIAERPAYRRALEIDDRHAAALK